MSIGANKVSRVSEDEIHGLRTENCAEQWLSPNEVNLAYMDVLSLKCRKYAKELSIGANEVYTVLEDLIHILRS
jgi:hypothetical protein